MKRSRDSVVRQMRNGQRGQMIAMVAFLMVALLAFTALSVDAGILYYSYQELVVITDAAALAGGAAISAGTAQTTAYKYSGDATLGGTGTYNVHPNLNITGVTATVGCISTATFAGLGLPPCIAYGAQASANAIQVTETAKVNTFFAGLFGVKSVTMSATATATAKGGQVKPYNIVLILDSTASMGNTTDPGCTVPGVKGAPTPEQCAQYGAQQLLANLAPCQVSQTSCTPTTGGMVVNPLDTVALMTFPGLCSQTLVKGSCPTAVSVTSSASPYADDDYACPATDPPITSYNNNPAYLILPYQADYRTSDTAALSNSSNIVIANGGGASPCGMPGIQTPGGEHTFYAGAITAAQTYLTSTTVQRTSVGSVQNIIILLSDGNANASGSDMAGTATSYPSTNDCEQAVTAATTAKNATPPTLIYSISYGSEKSGCPQDQTSAGGDGNYTTPCATMQAIASLPTAQYFFSVPQSGEGDGTVCPNARSVTSLNQVFTSIASDLTTSRLIPNSTF